MRKVSVNLFTPLLPFCNKIENERKIDPTQRPIRETTQISHYSAHAMGRLKFLGQLYFSACQYS
jgi:hypothetical protein